MCQHIRTILFFFFLIVHKTNNNRDKQTNYLEIRIQKQKIKIKHLETTI